jgi:TonB family protein
LRAWEILSLAQETPVRLVTIQRWAVGLILAFCWATAGAELLGPIWALGQDQAKQEPANTEDLSRKAKTKVLPVYPDVARRMSIAGTVRLAVVVSANGTVKSSKPVGGHPLLVDAAMDAMKRWKFETSPTESAESWNSSFTRNGGQTPPPGLRGGTSVLHCRSKVENTKWQQRVEE